MDAGRASRGYREQMRLRVLTTDQLVAAGVLTVAMVETFLVVPPAVRLGVTAGALIASAALLWRTSRPAASAVGVLGANVLVDVLLPSEVLWPIWALIVSMYSAGRYATPRKAVGVLVGGFTFAGLVGGGEDAESPGQFVLNYLFIAVLMVAVPWLGGTLLSRRERQSTHEAAEAVLDERLRMARELHDVVGHSLGAIAVQAGAERVALGDEASESTRETLMAIERATHEALGEMRRLVSVMRTTDDGDRHQPQPTLADVDNLLDVARRAGWTVRLRTEGVPFPVTPGVDITAYRIVQEAVTNALRHSTGSTLTVAVRYLPDGLELEVADDGTPQTPTRSGFGLHGMRERANLYGGQVSTGRADPHGFLVVASLPHARGAP